MTTQSTIAGNHPFHQILTSASRQLDVGDWLIDSRSLGLEAIGPFSISKRRLHGGRQEGVDLVRIETETLAATVVPSRGMGILKVESRDLCLEWASPVKEVVHPHFVNLESRGGLGWLQGFNEWLVRCGLEFAGAPGKDRFVTNTGATAEMELTLHGKIANIPASEVELIVDPPPRPMIRLRGRVFEGMFYGPKLELWTEFSIEPGAARFTVEDQVTNWGAGEQEFELIYHINFGAPLLGGGARFLAPLQRVSPMNENAASSIDQYAAYAGPTVGFIEQVYCLRARAGSDHRTTLLLQNPAADRGVSIRYSIDELPCLTLWKNTNSPEEGYVTGIEPGTNFPNNRRIEREAGRLGKLQPKQAQRFKLEFGLHSTRQAVQEVADRVAEIQGSHQPLLQRQAGSAA